MIIHTLPIGPLQANCYLIEHNKDAIIIDAPEDYIPVMKIINEKNLKVQALLCTHLHFDHVSGVNYFANETKAPIFAGKGDIDMKDVFFSRAMTFGLDAIEEFSPEALVEGLHTFGSINLECIHTPGHSPGGLCFLFREDKALISGDTLFHHSVGRSDLPGGDEKILLQSIKEKLFLLEDDTIVYPGHGRATSILDEKNSNPFLMF